MITHEPTMATAVDEFLRFESSNQLGNRRAFDAALVAVVCQHLTVARVAVRGVSTRSRTSARSLSTVETEPKDVQVGQPRLRWRVALVREGDHWLVDSFTNVTVEAAATPAPGAAPTQGSSS